MNKALVIIICFWSSLAIGQDWEVHTTALPANSTVIDFKVVSQNEIYAIGEPFKFAKWDGNSWEIISGLENFSIIAFSVFDATNIFVVSDIPNNNEYDYRKWNGSSWELIPDSTLNPTSIYTVSPTEVYVLNRILANYFTINRWDGTQWGYANNVYTRNEPVYKVVNAGYIYFETSLYHGGGQHKLGVMSYSNNSFVTGNSFSNQYFYDLGAMAWLNPYEFYVSDIYPSNYNQPDYSNNNHCWKWDNTSWTQLPDIDDELPLNKNEVNTMYVHRSNELYVGGRLRNSNTQKFIIGKWNGTNWSELGILDSNSEPQIDQEEGYLYAMGKFTVGTDSNAALIKRIDIGSNLGVSEPYQENGFQFYPNPAQDQISFNKTIDKVSLITVEGKIIKVAKIANQMRIDDISKGVYFLKFEQKDSVATIKKLIKN